MSKAPLTQVRQAKRMWGLCKLIINYMVYITEYSELGSKERRQLSFKRRYKEEAPQWDDSMVLLVNLLKQLLKDGLIVLDVGCGKHNFVLDELSFLFRAKIGVDVDEKAIEGNKSLDKILYSGLDHLPLAEQSVDVVVSLWYLNIWKIRVLYLKKFRGYLSPAAYLPL